MNALAWMDSVCKGPGAAGPLDFQVICHSFPFAGASLLEQADGALVRRWKWEALDGDH